MNNRTPMRERAPRERAHDFLEVNQGYSAAEAVAEARRCLQCATAPCVAGCPVGITIPAFIKAIAAGDPLAAARLLREKNNLPAICGRVCPQEQQCELRCILAKQKAPVAIGHLERYAADYETCHTAVPAAAERKPSARAVAVIGSGPAGLTCAADLAKRGCAVTVFESLHKPGGVLRYGIPAFRLPGAVVDREITGLERLGVRFVLNTLIGRTKSIADLFAEGFAAVFIGTGAGLPSFLNIPGENLNHIYSANEFLTRVNLMQACQFPAYDTPLFIGKNVVVIGGGNTAMDAARTAVRLGAENVTLAYRRSEDEMPARVEERRHAQEEGVRFQVLTAPVRFTGTADGFVAAVECTRMALGMADASGRRQAHPVPGTHVMLPADMAIIAIGLSPNPVLPSLTPGLARDRNGHLVIDENFMTTLPGVFAGGDIVGGDTVIQAMGMGKQAAAKIAAYLDAAPAGHYPSPPLP